MLYIKYQEGVINMDIKITKQKGLYSVISLRLYGTG